MYSHFFEPEFCQISENKEIQNLPVLGTLWNICFSKKYIYGLAEANLSPRPKKSTLSQFEGVRDKEMYGHPKCNSWWRVLNINASHNFKCSSSSTLCQCKAHPSVASFQSEGDTYLRYSAVLKRKKFHGIQGKYRSYISQMSWKDRWISMSAFEYLKPFITYLLLSSTQFLSWKYFQYFI